MKIDFTKVLLDLEEKPILEPEVKEGKVSGSRPLTLKSVCLNSLMGQFEDEKGLSGEEKIKRFLLAKKINEGGEELKSEEIAEIKKLVSKAYATLIVGRVFEILI